jgi:hypothetical protein
LSSRQAAQARDKNKALKGRIYDSFLKVHGDKEYSAQKAVTLIVKVANAGGAHMILVVSTVSLVLSAWVKFTTLI